MRPRENTKRHTTKALKEEGAMGVWFFLLSLSLSSFGNDRQDAQRRGRERGGWQVAGLVEARGQSHDTVAKVGQVGADTTFDRCSTTV